MGFKELKAEFEAIRYNNFSELTPLQRDAFTLICLFEIAGNLDTIAVAAREMSRRDAERTRLSLTGVAALEDATQAIREMNQGLFTRPLSANECPGFLGCTDVGEICQNCGSHRENHSKGKA